MKNILIFVVLILLVGGSIGFWLMGKKALKNNVFVVSNYRCAAGVDIKTFKDGYSCEIDYVGENDVEGFFNVSAPSGNTSFTVDDKYVQYFPYGTKSFLIIGGNDKLLAGLGVDIKNYSQCTNILGRAKLKLSGFHYEKVDRGSNTISSTVLSANDIKIDKIDVRKLFVDDIGYSYCE